MQAQKHLRKREEPQIENSQSPLFSLPTEIRLEVYRNLLVWPPPIRPKGFYGSRRIVPELEPSILRTCRQIRDEALPLLYSENVFFDYVEDHHHYLEHEETRQEGFPYHHLALMKHVNLKTEGQHYHLDHYTARSIQFYIRVRPALLTFHSMPFVLN